MKVKTTRTFMNKDHTVGRGAMTIPTNNHLCNLNMHHINRSLITLKWTDHHQIMYLMSLNPHGPLRQTTYHRGKIHCSGKHLPTSTKSVLRCSAMLQQLCKQSALYNQLYTQKHYVFFYCFFFLFFLYYVKHFT